LSFFEAVFGTFVKSPDINYGKNQSGYLTEQNFTVTLKVAGQKSNKHLQYKFLKTYFLSLFYINFLWFIFLVIHFN